ncbi:S1-like domain-containing RNA-binding protein [Methylomonas sp. AM2-LC]|uniref:CvfB family protein n=1 Tax=Methylomonas sp. AM2-LC TaxID=3153301 RepID=UPI0032665179
MLAFGKFNTLPIIRIRDQEVFLDGGEQGEIVLLEKQVAELAVGSMLNVFVYIDGKNQLQATLQIPKAQVDEVAWLKVVSLSHAGAFMDWGLPKDLLVPFSEQKSKMVEGRYYLVRLFLDEDNRIAASMLLEDFIQEQAFYFKEGQAVELIIAEETDLGVKAVINHQYWGVLYKNEIFQTLQKGQKLTGYIKKIRPDHKIDLALTQEKYGIKVDTTSEKVLAILAKHGGYIALTDKSPPEMIYDTFAVSKKVFKQAIGGLYKQRKISIEEHGIRLVP